ncbi:MAG: hypothetical protein WBW62_01775 [Solirubrobacterales bacterium]
MENGGDSVNSEGRINTRAVVVGLAVIVVLLGLLVLCLGSTIQTLKPVNMPFGQVGSSSVVSGVQDEFSLDTTSYSNEADARSAVEQGDVYAAYVTGSAGDKLILAEAKSFFGGVEITAAFESAAEKEKQKLSVENAVPLPKRDRVGAVSALLLLPTLIGGYFIAMMLAKSTGTVSRRARLAVLLAFSVASALVIDLIAGPLIGAYSNDHFWSLLPFFALVTFAVSASASAIMGLAGRFGTLLVALLFIVLGGASAGGAGVSLLPEFWQSIGPFLPPQNAVEIFRNVIYFDGHNNLASIIVLGLYAVGGVALLFILEQRQARTDDSTEVAEATAGDASAPGPNRLITVGIPIAIASLLTCLFAVNYMSSGHSPEATDMPFGTVGSSKLVSAVGEQYSLSVTEYSDEAAAKEAIDKTDIWGALVSSGTSSKLIVVPSISDIAPLDMASEFEEAAKELDTPVKVEAYTPTPLAENDPGALFIGLLLLPMLIGGYMGASVLANATSASGRGHGMILLGFAVVGALVMDVIATVVLKGLPGDAFLIAWPIMTLVILVVAMVTAVLRRLLGPLGIVATLIVFIQFGNPSSGGSNGVPYLPDFWASVGPFLPPRNAFILLQHSVYFGGNGTFQALAVLLAYLIVFVVIFSLLNWFRSPTRDAMSPETEQATGAAAAGAVSSGVA